MAAAEPKPPEISRRGNHSTNEARNAHLVVAAATFQASINPPGGVWQDDLVVNGTYVHHAGKAILASSSPNKFKLFIVSNSVAFSCSVFVIITQTFRLPFFLETYMALASMAMTFGASARAVAPPRVTDGAYPYLIPAMFLPIVVSVTVRGIKYKLLKRNNQEQGGQE